MKPVQPDNPYFGPTLALLRPKGKLLQILILCNLSDLTMQVRITQGRVDRGKSTVFFIVVSNRLKLGPDADSSW
jgi:hypothetical protein